MDIGFFQFDPAFGEVERNVRYVSERLSGVKADLIVLPELFNTGYQFASKEEVSELGEPIPEGPTTKALINLCEACGFYAVAGLAERKDGDCYNSAILVGPEGLVGLYRKTHLFAEEKLFFAAGDTGFNVFEVMGARIGLMICFDWIFPESMRSLALGGADIVCQPANLVLPHCPDAMVTRCLENHVFAVTANRVGFEERGGKEKLLYIGQSEIVAPDGGILCRASAAEEEAVVVSINPLSARDKKINPFNDILSDRRPDLYRC